MRRLDVAACCKCAMAGAGCVRGRSTRPSPTRRGNYRRRHSFLMVRRHTNTVDITYSSHSKNPSTRPGNTPDSNFLINFYGMRNLKKDHRNRLRAIRSSIQKT
ncbi:hypothetical protein BCEN4_550048 [Burkholderia cenocepacia]|nr:hypothetical protein BCEN4_550048 [Burkholderia cenocepacia]